jgi:hypothetical protein
MAQNLLATMITTTTYGTWLPGDVRGYVEHGIVLPPAPRLESRARLLLTSEPVLMSRIEQNLAADILVSACERFGYPLFCLSIECWHLHWLTDCRSDAIPTMVARLKNAIRQALGRGRIWTAGYDKRFCFSLEQVNARYEYIARHAGFRDVRKIALG